MVRRCDQDKDAIWSMRIAMYLGRNVNLANRKGCEATTRRKMWVGGKRVIPDVSVQWWDGTGLARKRKRRSPT